MLHNLEEAICIHLLKIASDSNFKLLFWKKLLAFSKLASAKFDPVLILLTNCCFMAQLQCSGYIGHG